MKGIKMICVLLFALVSLHIQAQEKFVKVKSLKNIKATVKVISEKMVVVVPDDQPNQRYMATELPEELKKDGLRLSIDGDLGEIPPNVRMIGTPFHITCIKVSREEQRKFKLSKKSYCLMKK